MSGSNGGFRLQDVETGAEEQVTVEPGVRGGRFSQDRRWFYYGFAETRGDVWMLDHE